MSKEIKDADGISQWEAISQDLVKGNKKVEYVPPTATLPSMPKPDTATEPPDGMDADGWEQELKETAPRFPRFQRSQLPLESTGYTPLETERICGIARDGDFALYGSPAKGNKTWAVLDAAIAVQTGTKFLEFETQQGDVLFVNTELSQALFERRMDAILRARGMPNSAVSGMDTIHLRGVEYSTFLPKTPEEIAKFRYDIPCFEDELTNMDMRRFKMIVVDPLYPILDGEENSNSEMRQVVLMLSKIATRNKTLLLVTHHFAKGKPGDKEPIDRFCGASVFARAPDALITMTPMKTEPEDVEVNGKLALLEMSLRGFKEPLPAAYRYKWPRFYRDENITATTANQKKTIDEPTFKKAVATLPMPVTSQKLADYFSVGIATIYRYLATYGIKLAADAKETPDEALKRMYDLLPKPMDVKRMADGAQVTMKVAKAWLAANVQDEAADTAE